MKLTWDDLREQARTHQYLSSEQRQKAVLAYNFFQQTFGDTFFVPGHPLFFQFLNLAACSHEWAIWFSDFLQSFAQHPDFLSLTTELRNPERYGERLSVLCILEILIQGGFLVSLDEPVTVNCVQKKPDILARLSAKDSGFFIEVSSLAQSQRQREANEVFRKFYEIFLRFNPGVNFCGRLLQILAPPRFQEIQKTVIQAAQKAVSETGFETVEIPGTLELAIANNPESEYFLRWAEIHGVKPNEFMGPDVNTPEFDRVSFKLAKELEQLPRDRANVVVIFSHLFAMPPKTAAEFASFVHALENEVFRHPHVGYFILVFGWTGIGVNEVIRYGDHTCVHRHRLSFDCDSFMLIKNRFAANPMPAETEQKFLEAFTRIAHA